VKQAQARTAGSAIRSKRPLYMSSRQRSNSGTALPILDLCAKTWPKVSTTPGSLHSGKDNRYPLYKGVVGAGMDGSEKSRPHRVSRP